MLLAYNELLRLIDDGVIENIDKSQVNSSSIDLRLGEEILVEGFCETTRDFIYKEPLNLSDRDSPNFIKFSLKEKAFFLFPGQFTLAQTIEKFNLPLNISAEFKLKSSVARTGLEQLDAGWCDAGWNNSVLTLELKNVLQYHAIALHYGDFIGQMTFYKHEEVPEEVSYRKRGRYNNDLGVQKVKV